MINRIIKFFLENKLITLLLLVLLILWGLATAPFDWNIDWLPRDAVAVDAIPDIGENQQIVFTEWEGRSPQDIDDQITYPLTTYLLGIPGVKTIRSSSMFGFSSIYIIFNEDIEFYFSRTRILEKLNALPSGMLPDEVQPTLGPDATALGQIFWYTLEGRDKNGIKVGGWDLHDLRSIQDFHVKYALNAAEGVSEVASIGGYVKEYQVDVNPDALKAYNISLDDVIRAVRNSNQDVGAKTIEINQVEYLVRGLGYIKSVEDLEKAVVGVNMNIPIRIGDIAVVNLGPASRRGLLDKNGLDAVGGVVVARYGSNPLQVINHVKDKIDEISPGLPSKTLEDGTISQITIVPFYDRTQLIFETLGTLEEALNLEILVTILVIIIMVANLRTSLVITSLLPVAVLMVFVAMRYIGIDANIVALSGIAIAIGTMVDIGIVVTENIYNHLSESDNKESKLTVIYNATSEVATAVITAVLTTIVSFIPVFFLQSAEGKLFGPLAYTKTFALAASLVIAIIFLPAIASIVLGGKNTQSRSTYILNGLLIAVGLFTAIQITILPGMALMLLGSWFIIREKFNWKFMSDLMVNIIMALIIVLFLSIVWTPLGASSSQLFNFLFVAIIVLFILGFFHLVIRYYDQMLKWCLSHKTVFIMIPVIFIIIGINIWLGFNTTFGWFAKGFDSIGINIRTTGIWSEVVHIFPGIGEEFMPSLDEGSFLLMPTSMPHAGIEQNKKILKQLDLSVQNIPEVEMVVGKAGRVESALDPAPLSMYENVINYKPEYMLNDKGHRKRFKMNRQDEYLLKDGGSISHEEAITQGINAVDLIPDRNGNYFRLWRNHIKSPDDIWQEIVKATNLPGVTSAPKLQPIETRLVMLQTGMRAPIGIKVQGSDLVSIESFGLQLEQILKEIPAVKNETVFAERIVGKPYLLMDIHRDRIARYGLNINQIQQVIETAVGGMPLTQTVEGRERYPVRIRYPRELRDDPDVLRNILVPTPTGVQIPLGELVTIRYERGPQVIKSENTFLVGYVIFDKSPGFSEVEVVNITRNYLNEKISNGRLRIPDGISYTFTGNYENQVRASKRLSIIVPIVLVVIFLILYLQFKKVSTTLMVFSGIAVAFSGGFLMIWFYGQDWFLNWNFFGSDLREVFQVNPINLSVAVWVGFIALFGIATDDGVVMATYLDQSFERNPTRTISEIRNAVVEAGKRRIRPCLMTTATTILALLPVLSSTGKGSDIMVPMAIPAFGGMTIELLTLFVVPVLYSWRNEIKIKNSE